MNINNDDPRLADKSVRIALDHLTDKERIISQLEGGYARKVNSIISSSKQEYNKGLSYRAYNIEEASRILEAAGWIDSNNNGIRDKIINGRKEELSLRFHLTGSAKSTAIANILKESCALAGIEINPITKPYRATVLENFIPGDFELSISRITQHPGKDDPTLYHHSSSIGEGGRNYNKFSNQKADALLELLKESRDESVQLKAYKEFQKLMYDESPIIFLYSDQLRIVANKDKQPVISEKNPGYFVNAKVEI